MAVVEMTDEEKALLDLAYTDGERILEGKLFDYQEKALRELRTCREALEQRYPQENFKIISFQPSSKKGCVELQFIQPMRDETEYILKYENGEYVDNFYDVPYEREYDGLVEEILIKAGISARVYTSFPFLIGDVIRSGRDLMDRRPHLGRHTALYLAVKELPTQMQADEIINRTKQAFRENGIYSSGIIFFVLEMDQIKDCAILELDAYCRDRKHLDKIFSVTFKSFEVDK